MMTEHALVSVITAVRNGADYLPALIQSVLDQDYPHYEHIIIDDGSTDDGATVDVLRKYPHLRWWSRENRGQYATQNEGIAAAVGSIITVISADDTYAHSQVFSSVVEAMREDPKTDFIFGKTLYMDEHGTLLPYQLDLTGKYPVSWLRTYLSIQHCSLFVTRALVARGPLHFDPSYRYCGDWDWIIRLQAHAAKIKFMRMPFASIRIHATQTHRLAPPQAMVSEVKRVCENHGIDYRTHLVFRRFTELRAMSIKAFVILKIHGFSGLWKAAVEWRLRRIVRNH